MTRSKIDKRSLVFQKITNSSSSGGSRGLEIRALEGWWSVVDVECDVSNGAK